MAAAQRDVLCLCQAFHCSFSHCDNRSNPGFSSREFMSCSRNVSIPFFGVAFDRAKLNYARQHLIVIAAQEQSFGTRFFRLGGNNGSSNDLETPGSGAQNVKFGIRKKLLEKEGEEDETKSGKPKFMLNLKSQVGTTKGRLVRLQKEAIDLPFVSSRQQDSKTVFVAGATGQIGARVAQKLLREGFKVRGGVPDLFFAQQLAEFATQYGVITREEARRLNAVEFDFKSAESVAKAIGNAGKLVVTIGPTEDGPRSLVEIDDASRVIEAAKAANVAHVVVVYEHVTGISAGNPLAGLISFFSSIFGRRKIIFSDLINQIVDSDFKYTILKANSTEGLDDFSPETQNLVLLQEGTSTDGGKISKSQIAEVVAGTLTNTTISENKVIEVTTSPSAPAKPVDQLLSAITVDGRRVALAEAQAKVEEEETERERRERAKEQAQAAIEESRKAAQLATQLEAEAKRVTAEQAKAATLADKAQARAEAAAAAVDSLTSKVKELGISNILGEAMPSQSFGFSLGELVSKAEDKLQMTMGAATVVQGAPALPKKRKASAKMNSIAASMPTPKPQVNEIFGGLFKQETIYIDDS